MPFNINEFKSSLTNGGARTNLFEIIVTNPINGSGDQKLRMTAQATQVPQRDINQIQVAYFGRITKVAGVTQNYPDWNVTIINDEDWIVRNALEEWSHAINSPIGNIRQTSSSDQSLYKSTGDVIQYSQTGQVLRQYKFYGIWPVSVAAAGLDWGQDDIIRYDVTFSVDYWTVGDQSTTGFAGNLDA
jgi:hypothetical protein